jgi:hypothetical protein
MTTQEKESESSVVKYVVDPSITKMSLMSKKEAEDAFNKICLAWGLTDKYEKNCALASLIHFMNLNSASAALSFRDIDVIHVGKKVLPISKAYELLFPHPRRFHRYHVELALDLGREFSGEYVDYENNNNIAKGYGYMSIDVLAHSKRLTPEEKLLVGAVKEYKIDNSDYKLMNKAPNEVREGRRPLKTKTMQTYDEY